MCDCLAQHQLNNTNPGPKQKDEAANSFMYVTHPGVTEFRAQSYLVLGWVLMGHRSFNTSYDTFPEPPCFWMVVLNISD